MPHSTEQIEARLAAYIDGQLDETARQEIEKHLASNPQHRRLIDDLIEQKRLVESLPRESAPAEVLEVVQGHLERNALLNPLESELVESTMQINRWPQVRAVAAVLVVVAGLAAAVWFMLPSPRAVPVPLALNEADPVDPSLVERSSSTPDPDHAKTLAGDLHEPLPLAIARTPSRGMDDPGLPPPQLPAEAAPLAGETGPTDAWADRSSDGEGSDDGAWPLVLVVETANPQEFREQVTNFLVGNRIAWREVNEPMPDAMEIGPHQTVLASRFQQTIARLRDLTVPQRSSEEPSIQPGTSVEPASLPKGQAEKARQDEWILAENLTPRQVEQLDQLLRRNAGGTAMLVESQDSEVRQDSEQRRRWWSSVDTPQSPEPVENKASSSPLIRAGEELIIHVPELVAPGLEAENHVTVESDGTVRLPMLDPVEAAGLEVVDLERRIAERYREMALVPDARVQVRRASTQPVVAPGMEILDQLRTVGQRREGLPQSNVDVVIVVREPSEHRPPETNSSPTTRPAPTTLPFDAADVKVLHEPAGASALPPSVDSP